MSYPKLQVGDTVAIPVLAWGRDWAQTTYPDTWRSARLEGTVVEKVQGGKWKCDFQEEDPADRGSFLRKALELISRPGGIQPPAKRKREPSEPKEPKERKRPSRSSKESGT